MTTQEQQRALADGRKAIKWMARRSARLRRSRRDQWSGWLLALAILAIGCIALYAWAHGFFPQVGGRGSRGRP